MIYLNKTISDILLLNKDLERDYWKEKAEIPLFSKEPFDEYDDKIPDDEVITLKIDTRSAQERAPFNALVCASTGVGKDRLVKQIIKGYWKQKYKILVIEPKGYEMFNARYMGTGKRLHHFDKNEKLPMVGYCPNYARKYLEKNFPEMLTKVKFYSPDVSKLDYIEVWQSFGIGAKAAASIVEQIEKGKFNLDSFYSMVKGMDLHTLTKQAATSSLEQLQATNFFGTTKHLNLEKEWEEGNIVDVMYFSRDGFMMNTDIGLILDLVRDIGIRESKNGLDKVTKKLIVFNDAFYYAGLSATLATKMSGNINLAIRNIANCQNNFRTWGIDTIFIVQSPDPNAIFPSLIDGCTTKFISYTENPHALLGKIPSHAYQLITNTDPRYRRLKVNEDKYTYEWLYVRGKTRCYTGFPFDCSTGHIA
jgi:hypothetical protein